ncbi:Calpain-A [Nymphon striatum]|nr:Calpain-A [Nymphon striatum]
MPSQHAKQIHKEKDREAGPEKPGMTKFLTSLEKEFGEKGSGLRARGQVQDYEKVKAQCLKSGTLFTDTEFLANDLSIFYSRKPPKPFEWKRPHDIIEDPRFFVEGVSRFDIQQGELGDCWLLAAVANLTMNSKLFYQVVPDDQSFRKEDYAGIFHFRFWQYGKWIDVVVDDLLPTYYGRLVFLHSKENNEFWSALLEKAYAKLHGSYEALKGGTTCEAMEDFTGGVTEFYDLSKPPQNLFQILLKAFERRSMMGCSIDPDPKVTEAELANGLIMGHAYSITRVQMVDVKTSKMSGKIPLLRIRNPWGNEAEWKGAWSDKSREWTLLSEDEKKEIGLTFDDDGEFWMSFKDFSTNFMKLEICNLNADSLEEGTTDRKRWETQMYDGSWAKGCSAGGCRNFLDTFWHNPQYHIKLEDPDDEDEDEKCTIIVGLMQKDRRAKRKMGMGCLTIGYAVYHLKDQSKLPKPLDKDFFKFNASVARSPSFINTRQISCRFKLPPGDYCIVPSTFDPQEEGDFILRVFSEKENNMEENDQETGFTDIPEKKKQEPTPEESEQDVKIREFFAKIAGEDLEIDCDELMQLLNFALQKEFTFEGFSMDVCRSMIATMDRRIDGNDYPENHVSPVKDLELDMDSEDEEWSSSKLGLEEFKTLWNDIRIWKNVFKEYDTDKSGSLNTFELRAALNASGYKLNNHILKVLVLRYATKNKETKEMTITFDNFILCAVKLKTMIETFNDRASNGRANFSMNEVCEYCFTLLSCCYSIFWYIK